MQPSKHDSIEEHVLAADIAAFETVREQLEREHRDEFALFFQGQLLGLYKDFDSAGRAALAKSKTGPFLIQQIGTPIGLDPDSARHLRHR
jgi:hypothetical protein